MGEWRVFESFLYPFFWSRRIPSSLIFIFQLRVNCVNDFTRDYNWNRWWLDLITTTMGSRGGNNGGGGVQGIPAASRKMVQSLKEIVNGVSEAEIYSALKDCNMDPNEAVNRLLSQGI